MNVFIGLAVAGAGVQSSVAGDAPNCKAVANKGSNQGGVQCESKALEFTPAYSTAGTATKITGDPRRMTTFFSQIEAGYKQLEQLSERWDVYAGAGDGDVVRRLLGTVGNKSPLHNIRKAFEGAVKVAATSPLIEPEQFEDLDTYYNAALSGIAEIDYNLYSTAFVGTEETANKLRGEGRKALDKTLSVYAKLLEAIRPVVAAEAAK